MSEEKDNDPGASKSAQFALQKIYLKDVSYESPDPAGFFSKSDVAPEINMQLNTESTKLSDDVFEVVLSITVTATSKEEDKPIYLVEVKQAGIFTMMNFPNEELGAMINSFCPNILFPYARELISSMVSKGGFPQLLLAPLNFDALYQQHVNKVKNNNAPSSDATH